MVKPSTLRHTLVHPCTLWCTLFHSSTLWYTLVHSCTHGYTLVHPSTLQYTLIHSSIFWYTLIHPSTLWYTLLHLSKLWYAVVHPSTLWYILVHHSKLWYTLVHPSTPWYTLVQLYPLVPAFGNGQRSQFCLKAFRQCHILHHWKSLVSVIPQILFTNKSITINRGIHLRVVSSSCNAHGHSNCQQTRPQQIYFFCFSQNLSKMVLTQAHIQIDRQTHISKC